MNLKQAIDALGDTEEQVVAALKERGIKGVPVLPCSCPIANYLKECGLHVIGVSQCNIDVCNYHNSTPWWIANFITHFDRGQYPELECDPLPDKPR